MAAKIIRSLSQSVHILQRRDLVERVLLGGKPMAFPHSLPPALPLPRPAHRPPSALDQALLHRSVLPQRFLELLVQLSNSVNQAPQTIQGQKSVRRMPQESSIGEMESQKRHHCHQATSPRALLQNILSNLPGLCGTGRQRPSTPITKNLQYP